MITGISHLGIATEDLETITRLYRSVLPDSPVHTEEIEDQGVRATSFKIGDTDIEFLEPLRDDSPIARFIKKQGSGVHHIALNSDDITGEMARLKEKGFRLIDETPRWGAGGKKIAFLHPKSTGGILLELCQE